MSRWPNLDILLSHYRRRPFFGMKKSNSLCYEVVLLLSRYLDLEGIMFRVVYDIFVEAA